MTAHRRTRIASSSPVAGRRASGPVDLPPPDGARVCAVSLDDDEYLIFTVPMPVWDMPRELTEAERAIALAILRGASNEDVARERQTSVHTVANQIACIFSKLGVCSRIELAYRLGSRRNAE